MKPVLMLLLLFCLAGHGALPAFAGDVWRPGHFYSPDAAKSTPAGQLPPGAKIVLEDGSTVDVATLPDDDAFRQLVAHWIKARRNYHSDPTFVNGFVYKLDSVELGPGTRNIEIRYQGAGIILHTVKGVTHVIK